MKKKGVKSGGGGDSTMGHTVNKYIKGGKSVPLNGGPKSGGKKKKG